MISSKIDRRVEILIQIKIISVAVKDKTFLLKFYVSAGPIYSCKSVFTVHVKFV